MLAPYLTQLQQHSLIADREFRLTDCDLRVNYEINLLTARRDLEYNLLQVRYDSLEERSTALSNLRDQEIADLQEMVRKHPNRNSHWFFAGGFIVWCCHFNRNLLCSAGD